MRSRCCVSLIGLLLVSFESTALGADNPEAIVKEICSRRYTEGPSEGDLAREAKELAALAEPGRKALRRLARSKDPAGGRARSFLVSLGDEQALPIARELLGDRKATPKQQEDALWMVGKCKDLGSLDRVLVLFRSDDLEVVAAAGRTLSALRDPRALAALRQALEDPRCRRVRGAIIEAVGVPGHEEAVNALVELLQDPAYEADEYPRGLIMQSLARIGTVRSRTHALSIARTIDHTDTLGRRMLHNLLFIVRGPQPRDSGSGETSELDAMIRELEQRLEPSAQASPSPVR